MTTTPNSASVALIRKDEVLLIQRAYAPYQHLWTLPGGRTDPGETAEQCAAREVREELGLVATELQPVMVQSLAKGEWLLAVFATQVFEGEIVPSDEISDHRWVRRNELAGFRTTSRLDDVLARAFALYGRS
jgi:8-oxo-dGTP diphosphatase